MAWFPIRTNVHGYRAFWVVGVILVVILTRLGWDQLRWQKAAQQHLAAGNSQAAVVYLARILNAHVPFSPIESEALATVLALAAEFEKQGDQEMVLRCYETARSSRFLARHFWIPNNQVVGRIEQDVARIKASELVKRDPDSDYQKTSRKQSATLNREFTPSVYWSTLAVSACFLYLGAAVRALQRGNKPWKWLSLTSFAVWIAALYLA